MANNFTPISTKQTTTSHVKPLNTKKIMTYDIGNPGHGLGQSQKCGRIKLNWLMGSLLPLKIEPRKTMQI
jgi:hypothetical protein